MYNMVHVSIMEAWYTIIINTIINSLSQAFRSVNSITNHSVFIIILIKISFL